MTRTEIRWVLLPFEVVLAFILVGIAAGISSGALHIWLEPFAGFFAAFAVVGIAYIRAPARKLLVATVALLLGGAISYHLLKHSSYPENYASPYTPTLVPFWTTLCGGALALVVAAAHTVVSRRSPSNTSLERTREG